MILDIRDINDTRDDEGTVSVLESLKEEPFANS